LLLVLAGPDHCGPDDLGWCLCAPIGLDATGPEYRRAATSVIYRPCPRTMRNSRTDPRNGVRCMAADQIQVVHIARFGSVFFSGQIVKYAPMT
jgi:hypothetical protein